MGTILFISGGEVIIVVLVVLLLFGAKSIPDVARMLGKGMNEFRRASDEIKREFRENTSDITDVVEETKKELNQEVKEVNKVIEEETTDLDPYNLNTDEATKEVDSQKNNEVPPTPDGPISREDSVDS
jgi:sec-independent protein translocase protein TatA